MYRRFAARRDELLGYRVRRPGSCSRHRAPRPCLLRLRRFPKCSKPRIGNARTARRHSLSGRSGPEIKGPALPGEPAPIICSSRYRPIQRDKINQPCGKPERKTRLVTSS